MKIPACLIIRNIFAKLRVHFLFLCLHRVIGPSWREWAHPNKPFTYECLLLSPWSLSSLLTRGFNCLPRVQIFKSCDRLWDIHLLLEVWKKNVLKPCWLWFTRNIRLSHGFFLNHQTSWSLLGLHWGPFLTTRARVSSFVCTGSEAVYLCWEVGWVEINKECLCQYLCEQSSWHLAVNWGGDFGLAEVEKYEPLLVCGSLVFPGVVLHCFCYESSLAQALAWSSLPPLLHPLHLSTCP